MLDLGAKATSAITIALVVAFLLHGTAVARTALMSIDLLRWSKSVQGKIAIRLTDEIDLDTSKPVEPPPPQPPPEPEQEKAPTPAAANAAAPEAPPPPPEAAQAGKVLTAEPDPNDPVDLTGGGFVTGTGTSYAGGVTQANGTGKTAVYNPAAKATGVPGGTGTAPAPVVVAAGPDKSRGAGLSGASEWKCPWPAEAEAEQIDEAFVKVQVAVGANGKASNVSVLSDPGHGFAREAQRCAMRESFAPALDHEGNPIVGTTKVLKIHFER